MQKELRHISAFLTEDQVQRIEQYMSENRIRFFSDGLRKYVCHLESDRSLETKAPAPEDKACVAA
jgi:hypothetical protein